MTDRFIDAPPAGLEGWRDVWRQGLRYPEPRGWKHRLVTMLLGPLVRRALVPLQERQRDFNLSVLDLVED